MTRPAVLSSAERAAALAGLPDWRYSLGALHAVYEAASVVAALELIQAIGEAAEAADHHPDVDWRYRHVFIRTSTHSVGAQATALDFELAGQISLAASAAATARPELIRSLEIGVDTPDAAAITDTWKAALGYRANAEGVLLDPFGRLPAVWFQETANAAPSRIHLDITVEDSTADSVLDEVTAHGGLRIDESFRPSWTVVADAQGNRFCVCTNLGREDPA
jgi:4a-hydroxytetrahydrobiopterin dehydratase